MLFCLCCLLSVGHAWTSRPMTHVIDRIRAAGDVPCGALSEKLGLKDGTTIGRYTLERCVGGGSFGEVWKASGSDTIVKVVRSSIDENEGKDWRGNDVNDELLKECVAAQYLSARDNSGSMIPDCLELGLSPAPTGVVVAFLAMPEIKGQNLEKSLLESGSKPFKELPTRAVALSVLMQLFEATLLQLKESPIILHKDMQPSNLIVHQGNLTVLDYGEMYFCCLPSKSQEGLPCTVTLRNSTAVGDTGTGFEIDGCHDAQVPGQLTTMALEALRDTMRLVMADSLMMLCQWWSSGPPHNHPVLHFAYGSPDGDIVDVVKKNMRETYDFEGLEKFIKVLPEVRDVSTIEDAKGAIGKAIAALNESK